MPMIHALSINEGVINDRLPYCKVVLLFFSLQRLLSAVQKNATRGDPRSVVQAIDQFCRLKEWAMNVGDEKGIDFS